MWTAKIVSKEYTKDILQVGIEFSDGVKTFSESIDMTGGSYETLQLKIGARISTFETTATLSSLLDSLVAQKQIIDPIFPDAQIK